MELTLKLALAIVAFANGALGNDNWVKVGAPVDNLAAKNGGSGGGGLGGSTSMDVETGLGLGPSDQATDYETEIITETVAITKIIDSSRGGADCATGPGANLAQINIHRLDLSNDATAVQPIIDALNPPIPGDLRSRASNSCPSIMPVELIDYSFVEALYGNSTSYTTMLVSVPAGACWNETLNYWGSKEFYEILPLAEIFNSEGRPLNQGNLEGCPIIDNCLSQDCFSVLNSDEKIPACLQCNVNMFQSENLTSCENGPCPGPPDPDCFGSSTQRFCGYNSVYTSFNVTAGSGGIVSACFASQCCNVLPVPPNVGTGIVKCPGECIIPPSPTASPTTSPSPSTTPSVTPTASTTPSVTPTASTTPSVTASASTTPSVTASASTTPSVSASASVTPTISTSPSVTPSATPTTSPSPSASTSPSSSPSPTSSPVPACYPARNDPNFGNAPLDVRCGTFCVLAGVLTRTGDFDAVNCVRAEFDASGDTNLQIRSLASQNTIEVPLIGFSNQDFDATTTLANIIEPNTVLTFEETGVTTDILDEISAEAITLRLINEPNIPSFGADFFDSYPKINQIVVTNFDGNFVFNANAVPAGSSLNVLSIRNSSLTEIDVTGLPTATVFDFSENELKNFNTIYSDTNAIQELALEGNVLTRTDFASEADIDTDLAFPADLAGTDATPARLQQGGVFPDVTIRLRPEWYNNLCNVALSYTGNRLISNTDGITELNAAQSCAAILAYRSSAAGQAAITCGATATFTCTP